MCGYGVEVVRHFVPGSFANMTSEPGSECRGNVDIKRDEKKAAENRDKICHGFLYTVLS